MLWQKSVRAKLCMLKWIIRRQISTGAENLAFDVGTSSVVQQAQSGSGMTLVAGPHQRRPATLQATQGVEDRSRTYTDKLYINCINYPSYDWKLTMSLWSTCAP